MSLLCLDHLERRWCILGSLLKREEDVGDVGGGCGVCGGCGRWGERRWIWERVEEREVGRYWVKCIGELVGEGCV